MSITSQEYANWLDSVRNTNRAMDELKEAREINYKWMSDKLREFFSNYGDVANIHFTNDAKYITIRVNGEIELDAKAFASLPFNFTVDYDWEQMDIIFKLRPFLGDDK